MKAKSPATEENVMESKIHAFLSDLGLCPYCGERIIYDMDEPFASCGCCGTMEWTSKPPLLMTIDEVSRLQILEVWNRHFGKVEIKMEEEKPTLHGLFRDNPDTPEGKYLVKRRDGSVVEWPHFVLGARDTYAIVALMAYADAAGAAGEDPGWVASMRGWANKWEIYRQHHGTGDPGKGKHRKDDPATVAEMKKGFSA